MKNYTVLALMELAPDGEWSFDGQTPPSWTFDDPERTSPTVAEVEARADELSTEVPLSELREERNKKLAETDWWASSDLTMTAEQAAYRQALRDITDTYSSLNDVVWPEKP